VIKLIKKFIENHINFNNNDKIKLIKITISNTNKPLVIISPYSFDGIIRDENLVNNMGIC